ncbi:MAG: DNA polymerase III subunit beta [Planctomycetota bacterium]|jgi:DNA polymerase-3 subunit beta
MKFSCSRERLLGALQIVGNIVSSRGMKPVYESVHILSRKRNGQDTLELQGTDLEVAIRFSMRDEELEVEEQGALVVPAARLTSILREVRDDRIRFSWDRNVLSLNCEGSDFKIMGLPSEEFPEIPDFPEKAAVTLPSQLFCSMIARTAFATAREKMRYALNGVLLLLKGGTLQMVGTDGRRLAHTRSDLSNPSGAEIRAIVPTKGMAQISRVVGEEEETLDLALSENQLALKTEHAVIVSRLVEGSFPNFEEVIPINCEHRATMDREALIAAIRKAALLTNKESQSVRFGISEGELSLSARAVEVGEAHVRLGIEFEGDAVDVAFNPTYVLDGLAVMDEEKVSFEFRNPTSPAKLSTGESFTYVVMPISIE